MASLSTQELLGKVRSSLTKALEDGSLGRALEETLEKKVKNPARDDLKKKADEEPAEKSADEKELALLVPTGGSESDSSVQQLVPPHHDLSAEIWEKLRESLAQGVLDGSIGKALQEVVGSKSKSRSNSKPNSEAPTAPPSPSTEKEAPGSEGSSFAAANEEEVATAFEAFEAAALLGPENPPSEDCPLDAAPCASSHDLEKPKVVVPPELVPKVAKQHRDGWVRRWVRCACGKLSSRPGPEEE